MSPVSDEFDVLLEPRIAIHLDAATQLLDYLDRAHAEIADKTDLALDGDTRQAAVWVVSGRCIGLGRAVVHLLRGGFCAEAAAQARVLHEANRVLGAIGDIIDSGVSNEPTSSAKGAGRSMTSSPGSATIADLARLTPCPSRSDGWRPVHIRIS